MLYSNAQHSSARNGGGGAQVETRRAKGRGARRDECKDGEREERGGGEGGWERGRKRKGEEFRGKERDRFRKGEGEVEEE
eukprot:1431574-Pleurochrysis_carterae.AAC.1